MTAPERPEELQAQADRLAGAPTAGQSDRAPTIEPLVKMRLAERGIPRRSTQVPMILYKPGATQCSRSQMGSTSMYSLPAQLSTYW